MFKSILDLAKKIAGKWLESLKDLAIAGWHFLVAGIEFFLLGILLLLMLPVLLVGLLIYIVTNEKLA